MFNLQHKDIHSKARTGRLITDHGVVTTPAFMPVGTLGTVKGVHQKELKEEIKAQIILSNTYHLYLRPGTSVLENAGGIHSFIHWDAPILTDSGGYQVFSLSNTRKISEEGVMFNSHIDGSKHLFTPEKSIDIQRSIGADIIMAFDECTPYPCEYNYAKNSMELTHRWLNRSCRQFDTTKDKYDYKQFLFPIVQGSTYKDLRKQSAEVIASFDRAGNAIGGLSVGEPHEEMYAMTDIVCAILPIDKPRYLMGVGTPENILECMALGIDMFDCVIPTRNARHGILYTSHGIINIKNEKWKNDFSVIDTENITFVDKQYSKSYLRHLFVSNELLAAQIATIHNLGFYMWLFEQARKQIEQHTFSEWKNKMVNKMTIRL